MHVGIEKLLGTVEVLQEETKTDETVSGTNQTVEVKGNLEPPMMEDPYNEDVGNETLKLLFDETYITQMTDVNERLVVAMDRAEFMADRYNSPILKEYVLNMKKLRVSLNRKGREETSRLLSDTYKRDSYFPEPLSLTDKLFGGKN